jgi:hypothetical protein
MERRFFVPKRLPTTGKEYPFTFSKRRAGASFFPNSEMTVEISNFGERGVERVRSSPFCFKDSMKSLNPEKALKVIPTPLVIS